MKAPSSPIPAAIYRRVSTDHQDGSLELQEKRVGQYAELKGLASTEGLTFSDPDTSGRTPMRERPGGRALLNRLQLGDVKHLVVAKLDRLGRNARDSLGVLELLKEKGIVLHIVDLGGESISTQGHIGKMILTVLMAIAEWEVEEIRDRTQKEMNAIFERGGLTGNVPYGFDCRYTFADESTQLSNRALSELELKNLSPHAVTRKLLVDNAEEQRLLRVMHSLRTVSGWKLKPLADYLNRIGSTTKLGRPWQCGSVDSVLKSRHTARLLQAPALAEAA